ncbi:restriction endonuclease subunit S [Rummeliibacillus sp. TYF005]|uniref:restriction endonuclease subunit S n=1 Tax=Rummeliibacillus sp. TYF005 TaxID=2058214 RepID=UPI0013DE5326|nr:restriction endonuclease subunit S [Rummeliibacillus sp. TYF005]
MTELGEIPVEWDIKELNTILEVRDGTHDSPKYIEKGIPFLTSKNLKDGKLDFSEVNYISNDDHINFSRRSFVENGDILFGMIGTVGNPVIVDLPFEISIKNVALIKFKSSTMNNKYILEYLNSGYITKQFRRISNGGVQKFIALGEIRKLKVIVPSIFEQKKIADILSTVDTQIEQTEQMIEQTKELKHGLMQQLLTKGIGHTEFKNTEKGITPANWKIEKIDNIASVTKLAGYEFTEHIEYIEDGEIIALRALNVKNGKLVLKDLKFISLDVSQKLPRSQLKIDDLLFSYVGTVGEMAIIDMNNKYHLAPNVAKITVNSNMYAKFLMYFMYSALGRKEINKFLTTTSQPALSMGNIRAIKVIVPPLHEQQKIAEILSSVDNQIDIYEKEKDKYEELKKGLMQQLLTGKIRVKVDE